MPKEEGYEAPDWVSDDSATPPLTAKQKPAVAFEGLGPEAGATRSCVPRLKTLVNVYKLCGHGGLGVVVAAGRCSQRTKLDAHQHRCEPAHVVATALSTTALRPLQEEGRNN